MMTRRSSLKASGAATAGAVTAVGIASTKPPYALLAATRNSIRGDHTWSFTTIEAGHDSMVTAPDELASLLMVVCNPGG
jgi:hypothetical protein